ncbi:hypothetical protein GGI43DRAFT_415768 [Trichoderma evansii]
MRMGAIVCDILADRFWIARKKPIAYGPTTPDMEMERAAPYLTMRPFVFSCYLCSAFIYS